MGLVFDGITAIQCSECGNASEDGMIVRFYLECYMISECQLSDLLWRASVPSRGSCTVDLSSWEKQLSALMVKTQCSAYYPVFTHSCTKHTPQLLPSRSEATPHENHLYVLFTVVVSFPGAERYCKQQKAGGLQLSVACNMESESDGKLGGAVMIKMDPPELIFQ